MNELLMELYSVYFSNLEVGKYFNKYAIGLLVTLKLKVDVFLLIFLLITNENTIWFDEVGNAGYI